MAMAAVHRTLGLMELLQRDLAGAQLLAHGDDVGPGADLPALVDAAELRTTRDTDRRQVGACSAHEKCGRCLVAAHQQHDPIEWVGADVLLDIHGRQVAVEHRSRPHSCLAAERCWDQVRWAIEAYAWRFDGCAK